MKCEHVADLAELQSHYVRDSKGRKGNGIMPLPLMSGVWLPITTGSQRQ